MRLHSIIRHPVKGFTPEQVSNCDLKPGSGIPFDRAFAFISGNLPDRPKPGVWVQARTFFQLTVYPELAKFRSSYDDRTGMITITAPDGETASATSKAGDFSALEVLINNRLKGGSEQPRGVSIQPTGQGHWDFTDSCLSLINLASVRDIESAAGAPVDPLRFRGNLLIDGLSAWEEFSFIGKRLRVGDAEIDCFRPAMRCAATTVDPASGSTDINVPAHLRKLTGHLYCGIYARVVSPGRIAAKDKIEIVGEAGFNPSEQLPERSPPPETWPRFAVVSAVQNDGSVTLDTPTRNWPFSTDGSYIRLHHSAETEEHGRKVTLTAPATTGQLKLASRDVPTSFAAGQQVLITGPYPN